MLQFCCSGKRGENVARLSYYNEDLLIQHEAEARRRYALQDEVLNNWKASAKTIKEENETLLQKEARREAVIRIEDSARTVAEYDRVTILWDCLDIIKGWRLDKAVPKRTELLTDSEYARSETVIPAPIKHEWWRQLLGGNFLDVVYDCPHEIHDLTSSRPVYDLVKPLDENRKEILYYSAIRLWSPQRIAAMRGQTDRNIRKVYNKMMDEIRHKMFRRLYPRYKLYWSLTVSQTEFVERYITEQGKGEIRPELPAEVKTALGRVEHDAYISENGGALGEIQCVCVQNGQKWQFIHHGCGQSTAHCIRPDERSGEPCGGSSECGAACYEAQRRSRVTECHHGVCIEVRSFGVYACYTHNT